MDRADRKSEPKSASPVRWVAAGSAAVFLLTSAYQASWGQGAGGKNIPPVVNNNNNDGLSSAEKAGIAAGAGVGAGLIYIFFLGGRRRRHHDDDDKKVQALPSGQKAGELQLVPSSTSVEAGDVETFQLKARGEDGKWYSVTADDRASITVNGEEAGLVRQDGSKNAFCLPLSTPGSYDGKTVSVLGRYETANGEALTASTDVTLHVGSLATAH